MNKRLRDKNGITLVALIITIIILLILAGISIASLTRSGLFENEKEAKKVSEIADIKEQIKLDIYEKQLEDPEGGITEKQLKAILEKYGTINYEDNGTTIKGIKTKKGYEILLSDIYDASTIQQLLAYKVQPGDYVTYIPDSASTDEIITELGTYSGNKDATKNTSSTLTQETGLKWRVLDVVDGKVRLISELPTESKLRLSSENGYNNAVYLLDKICRTLYSKSEYSENVQNLKIEDIQNKMSIDYTTIDSSYGTKLSPTKKYYPSIFEQEEGQAVNGGTIGTLGLSKQETPINQTAQNEASSWTVKYTYWKKKMAENDFETEPIYYNLFIKNGKNYPIYWLSSRCISVENDQVHYKIRTVDGGYVFFQNLYDSSQGRNSKEYALRPVVTLNSNVIVKSGEGTSDSAYEIGL